MSYILNALRKSERERQAIEPETVTARIVAHQPPRHQYYGRLIAGLVAINLAVLTYFLGFKDKAADDKTSPAATRLAAADVRPQEATGPDVTTGPRSGAATTEPPLPGIAAIVAAQGETSVTAPAGKPAPARKQPADPVRPVVDQPRPVAEEVEEVEEATDADTDEIQTFAAPEPVPEQAQPEISQPEPVKNTVKKIAPEPKDDLPFLDELPAEFGRSLPELPINVFSYSSTPAERFVMIDMKKYIPGQRIKDQLELKEIRPDSIVVSYEGRTFKIRRP